MKFSLTKCIITLIFDDLMTFEKAASFNLDIAENIGRITAEETRAVGIPWNFNPVLDVGRQPLWPRFGLIK